MKSRIFAIDQDSWQIAVKLLCVDGSNHYVTLK